MIISLSLALSLALSPSVVLLHTLQLQEDDYGYPMT